MSTERHWIVPPERRPPASPASPHATHCRHCAAPLDGGVGGHMAAAAGDLCANARLHQRVVELEARLRRYEAPTVPAHSVEVAND